MVLLYSPGDGREERLLLLTFKLTLMASLTSEGADNITVGNIVFLTDWNPGTCCVHAEIQVLQRRANGHGWRGRGEIHCVLDPILIPSFICPKGGNIY